MARNRKHYAKNREKETARNRKYYAENREKAMARSRKYLSSTAGRARELVSVARTNSKKRNHPPPELTWEDLMPALEAGVCQVTGIKLDFTRGHGKGKLPLSPSLDRPDSTKPYTRDNFRIVCWAVNTGCSTWGLETYLAIAARALGVPYPCVKGVTA